MTAPEHIITDYAPVALKGFFFLSKLYFWEIYHLFSAPISCLSLIIAPDIYGEEKIIKVKVYNCLFQIRGLTNPQNIKSAPRCCKNIFQITEASPTAQLGNIKE